MGAFQIRCSERGRWNSSNRRVNETVSLLVDYFGMYLGWVTPRKLGCTRYTMIPVRFFGYRGIVRFTAVRDLVELRSAPRLARCAVRGGLFHASVLPGENNAQNAVGQARVNVPSGAVSFFSLSHARCLQHIRIFT